MLGQILITTAVILVAYLVVRGRREERGTRAALPVRGVRLPVRLLRSLAYALVGLMVVGSVYLLFHQWVRARETVIVEVINTNNGRITHFQARRGEVAGRTFVTLDGQKVTLADVERMILRDAPGSAATSSRH